MAERVNIAAQAYENHGFRGLVAFHFYNEPTLRADEMFATMEAIKAQVPTAGFLLWTNGTILPADPRMKLFNVVKCTDYHNRKIELEPYYKARIADVDVFPAGFDGRLDDWRDNPIDDRPCLRPLIEFIIDDWGNGRLCCQDWRGDVSIGNIRTEGLAAMLQTRRGILESVCRPMSDRTPERCRRCNAKIGSVCFVPRVHEAGLAHYCSPGSEN
jgi:hypothetical protein